MCICRVAIVKQAILSNWQALCQIHEKANCLAALSAFPGNAQVVSAVLRARKSVVFLSAAAHPHGLTPSPPQPVQFPG